MKYYICFQNLISVGETLARVAHTYHLPLHDLTCEESPIDSGPGNLSQNDYFEMAKLFHSDENYFECAHWMQAAMDVEKVWPDGIPNIKAPQSLDHIQDWGQSCFYSSHEKNQGQISQFRMSHTV